MDRFVVVTTEYRGVFFGKMVEETADTAILTDARNCTYWAEGVKGFSGLAVTGPDKKSRIGPKMKKIRLLKVTSVIDATPEAAEAWEVAPWG